MKSVFVSKKIKTRNQIRNIISILKNKGYKVGLCVGAYDLLHPGHVKHFESAKKICDILVVGITSDKFVEERKGKGRPIFNHKLRAYMVSQLETVDYVFINKDKTAVNAILDLKPSYYIKGPDYIGKRTKNILAEIKAIKKVGGKIKYTKDEKFSTSQIINKLKKAGNYKPTVILPFGLPAVGKTAILKSFCKKYSWFYIDKDLINTVLLNVYDEEGNLVEKHEMFDDFYNKFIKVQTYFLLFNLALDNLILNNNVVIDGYFMDKYKSKLFDRLINILRKKNFIIIKVYFKASKKTIFKRMLKRNLKRDFDKIKNFEKFYKFNLLNY
ncbi:MAG: adenylyltransferase/cytidyltransferase family protein, partial [Candidatus Woesearchaeota archaeon]